MYSFVPTLFLLRTMHLHNIQMKYLFFGTSSRLYYILVFFFFSRWKNNRVHIVKNNTRPVFFFNSLYSPPAPYPPTDGMGVRRRPWKLTYSGRDRDVKPLGVCAFCVFFMTCVLVCMRVCNEKCVPQLFMGKRDLKTTVCPLDRERRRWRRRAWRGGPIWRRGLCDVVVGWRRTREALRRGETTREKCLV